VDPREQERRDLESPRSGTELRDLAYIVAGGIVIVVAVILWVVL